MVEPAVWRVGALATGLAVVLAGCDLGTPPTTYATGHAVSAVAAGDLDGDGDGDVDAVAACACPSLSILRNDGGGAFAVTTLPSGLASTTEVRLIDLDGDGALDLTGRGTEPAPGTTTGVFVALADGAGGFGAPTLVPGSLYDAPPRPDVTGDGVPDMADVLQFENDLRLRAGDGDGGFGPLSVTPLSGIEVTGGTTFADMDGDGDDDLVASGIPTTTDLTSSVLVSPNDGTGAFGPPVSASIAAAASLEPTVADVNGDGAPDVIASIVEVDVGGRPYLTSEVSVVLADGSGGYAAGVRHPLPAAPGTAIGAAVDGDDRVDLVFADYYADKAWVAFGDGTGGFAARDSIALAGPANRAPAVADVDGDGAVDVLTPRSTGVTVFLNRL